MLMRYHRKEKPITTSMYGTNYYCDHPLYSECTLFEIGEKGLAVIQQRFDKETKHTWWSSIDKNLVDDIYLNPLFVEYFKEHARVPDNGMYPTVTVRQIMWGLKMKPLKREIWEMRFYT